MTPLLFAARDGRLDAAQLLVDAGADVNTRRSERHDAAADGDHQRPDRRRAVARRRRRRCQSRRLVRTHAAVGRGRDPQSRSREPAPPTTASIARPRCELITALIDKGADVNARVKEFPPQRRHMLPLGSLEWVDFTGQTAFIRAAQSADVPLMRLLLSKGADPQIDDVQRHDCADGGGGRELGRRPDLQRVAGTMARSRAALASSWAATSTPSTRWGSRPCTARRTAARTTSSSCWRSSGARLDMPDKEGRTPLDVGGGRVPRHQLAGRQAVDDGAA